MHYLLLVFILIYIYVYKCVFVFVQRMDKRTDMHGGREHVLGQALQTACMFI